MEDICGPTQIAPARPSEIAMVEVEYAVQRTAWFLKVERTFHLRYSGNLLTMSMHWAAPKGNASIGRFGQATLRTRVRSEQDTGAVTRLIRNVERMQTGALPQDRWIRVIRDGEVYMVLSDTELRPSDVKERFQLLRELHCNKHMPVATMELFRHPMPTRSHFETLLNRYQDWMVMADE